MRGIAIALEELLDWEFRTKPRAGTLHGFLSGRVSDRMRYLDLWSFQGEFTGLDELAIAFIQNPFTKPAVPSELGAPLSTYEDEVERALREGNAPIRAQALGILFAVRAPASVDAQWRAIEELRRACPALENPLSGMADAFAPEALLPGLQLERPPTWVIRAAGVTRLRKALPRLGELTAHLDRERGLAAVRSIEEFEGVEAEKELARCILHWSYDVYTRAGEVLFERNKDLMLETLLGAEAPQHCRWWQGLMLGRLGRVEAVPLIVSEVNKLHTLDAEMFGHLERLAAPEHRDILLEMPRNVRPDQRRRAEQVLEGYLARVSGR
jgi:hypothetical protein